MTDELLKKAMSDRDGHPWRYYTLDHDTMKRLCEDLITRAEKAEALYQELIYAVASKHPDETRHQTALRYIRQAETPSGDCASNSTAMTQPGSELREDPVDGIV